MLWSFFACNGYVHGRTNKRNHVLSDILWLIVLESHTMAICNKKKNRKIHILSDILHFIIYSRRIALCIEKQTDIIMFWVTYNRKHHVLSDIITPHHLLTYDGSVHRKINRKNNVLSDKLHLIIYSRMMALCMEALRIWSQVKFTRAMAAMPWRIL